MSWTSNNGISVSMWHLAKYYLHILPRIWQNSYRNLVHYISELIFPDWYGSSQKLLPLHSAWSTHHKLIKLRVHSIKMLNRIFGAPLCEWWIDTIVFVFVFISWIPWYHSMIVACVVIVIAEKWEQFNEIFDTNIIFIASNFLLGTQFAMRKYGKIIKSYRSFDTLYLISGELCWAGLLK